MGCSLICSENKMNSKMSTKKIGQTDIQTPSTAPVGWRKNTLLAGVDRLLDPCTRLWEIVTVGTTTWTLEECRLLQTCFFADRLCERLTKIHNLHVATCKSCDLHRRKCLLDDHSMSGYKPSSFFATLQSVGG